MSTSEQFLGQMLLLDSSDEDSSVDERKRRVEDDSDDARGLQEDKPSGHTAPAHKRARLSSSSESSSTDEGSEDGEVRSTASSQGTNKIKSDPQTVSQDIVIRNEEEQRAITALGANSDEGREAGLEGSKIEGPAVAQLSNCHEKDLTGNRAATHTEQISSGERNFHASPAENDDGPNQNQGQKSAGVSSCSNNSNCFTEGAVQIRLPELRSKKGGPSLTMLIKRWFRLLGKFNPLQATSLTQDLALKAFSHYLDEHCDFEPVKRKNLRMVAETYSKYGLLEELIHPDAEGPSRPHGEAQQSNHEGGEQRESVVQQPNTPANLGPVEDTASSPVTLQQRYFPSTDNLVDLCLNCARDHHSASHCPLSACKFCQGQRHWEYDCPKTKRCNNCLQCGHAASTCQEKLKLTREEGLACAFCASPDHMEEECADVWRSFQQEAGSLKLVVASPISCAICGAQDHFFSDCSQREYAANPTWSMANYKQYIDPDCGVVAIAYENEGASSAERPKSRIRGRPSQNVNVHYSESDDSEIGFLSNRLVKSRSPSSKMRMSTNIQVQPKRGGWQSASIESRRFAQPSGMPPAPSRGPASSSNRQVPSQPRLALPAKPPAPSQRYHNMPPPPPSVVDSGPQRAGTKSARGHSGPRGRGRGGRGNNRGRGRGRWRSST